MSTYRPSSWGRTRSPKNIAGPHGTKVQADTNLEATTTNDVYVEAKWTSIDGKFMVTVPIHGIDRIAFVRDGSLNDMVVRAACSTF